MENLVEKTRAFMSMEYQSTVRVLEFRTKKDRKIYMEDIYAPLQRCLGVAQFAQTLGVPFKKVDAIYGMYKELFEQLRDKYL